MKCRPLYSEDELLLLLVAAVGTETSMRPLFPCEVEDDVPAAGHNVSDTFPADSPEYNHSKESFFFMFEVDWESSMKDVTGNKMDTFLPGFIVNELASQIMG
jgi:hypothetical protein